MEQVDYKKLILSKFQLISKLKLMNIFPGDWESIYKGEGIEFDSTKPFEPGDNPKDLDLFTLAQSGEQEIILREEDRRMQIYIWVDLSGSMRSFNEMFFPSKITIRDIAIGLIAYSTCNNYTPLGLCAFDNDIRGFFTAKSGRDYCDEIIRWTIDQDYKSIPVSADMEQAVSFLTESAFSQNMIFFVSDFKGPEFEGNFSHLIKPLIEKFDFIPVIIRDPIEKNGSIKRPINIAVRNSEGDGGTEFYLTPQKLKEMQEVSNRHLFNVKWNFYHLGTDCIVLDSYSIDDCYHVLSGFFENRKRIRK